MVRMPKIAENALLLLLLAVDPCPKVQLMHLMFLLLESLTVSSELDN